MAFVEPIDPYHVVRPIVELAAKSARVIASAISNNEVVTRLSPERLDSCSS